MSRWKRIGNKPSSPLGLECHLPKAASDQGRHCQRYFYTVVEEGREGSWLLAPFRPVGIRGHFDGFFSQASSASPPSLTTGPEGALRAQQWEDNRHGLCPAGTSRGSLFPDLPLLLPSILKQPRFRPLAFCFGNSAHFSSFGFGWKIMEGLHCQVCQLVRAEEQTPIPQLKALHQQEPRPCKLSEHTAPKQ